MTAAAPGHDPPDLPGLGALRWPEQTERVTDDQWSANLDVMAGMQTASRRAYRGRPVVVPADLADLRGPTTGTVTLPVYVYWSGDQPREWDLDDDVDRREMYRTLVREARRRSDLDVLDGDTLVRIWPDLCRRTLPLQVRAAWEDRHPALAAARETATQASLPAAS